MDGVYPMYYYDKDQSSLAIGEVTNASFVFAKWQHEIDGFAANCNYTF